MKEIAKFNVDFIGTIYFDCISIAHEVFTYFPTRFFDHLIATPILVTAINQPGMLLLDI